MTGWFGGEDVTVPLPGPCRCPGSPHERDEVYLLPRLGWEGGSAADVVVRSMTGTVEKREDGSEYLLLDKDGLAKRLCRAYIEHQVKGWNLLGEDGAPLPFSPAVLLTNWDVAVVVGNAADNLYSEGLLAPLVASVSTSSPAGPTGSPTSQRTRSAARRRKR